MITILAQSKQSKKAFELFELLRKRDICTAVHSLTVACMAKIASRYIKINLSEEQIFIAGIMHDIGKLNMPDFIFENYKVSNEEFNIIKQHVGFTKQLMQEAGFDKEIIGAAYAHHERWNGKGYPMGLSGNNICDEGRLLAIVDSFAALTEDRAYRTGKDTRTAINILLKDQEQYDVEMLFTFITHINGILEDSNKEYRLLESCLHSW